MSTVIMHTYNGNHKNKHSFIAQLVDMLDNYALDRCFESCGDEAFAKNHEELVDDEWAWYNGDDGIRVYQTRTIPANVWHFSGNFLKYSFSYSVYTDKLDLIKLLQNATKRNQQRPDYLAQEQPIKHIYKTEITRHEPDFPGCLNCPANIIYA